jgi:hypothetical protein
MHHEDVLRQLPIERATQASRLNERDLDQAVSVHRNALITHPRGHPTIHLSKSDFQLATFAAYLLRRRILWVRRRNFFPVPLGTGEADNSVASVAVNRVS